MSSSYGGEQCLPLCKECLDQESPGPEFMLTNFISYLGVMDRKEASSCSGVLVSEEEKTSVRLVWSSGSLLHCIYARHGNGAFRKPLIEHRTGSRLFPSIEIDVTYRE